MPRAGIYRMKRSSLRFDSTNPLSYVSMNPLTIYYFVQDKEYTRGGNNESVFITMVVLSI